MGKGLINVADFWPLLRYAKQNVKNNFVQEVVILTGCAAFLAAAEHIAPNSFAGQGLATFAFVAIFGLAFLAFFIYCSFIQIFKREIKKRPLRYN